MKFRGMKLKILDYVALGVAAAAFAGSILLTVSHKGPPEVTINASKKVYVYPLDQNQNLVFPGPIGKTYVEIKDKQVRVRKDPGPLQICVIQGWISSPGQSLICLPNRVMIQIQGQLQNPPIDMLSY